MELLDRYLQAVKRHLPWQRQDDIIAELRANFEAQLEDKEAELGRPLTKEEAEEWLKQIGPPIQVAARYQRQQYLIGPAVFPTYSFILRLVLTWATVIYAFVNAVDIAVNNRGGEGVLSAALRLPEFWLINAGVVTLIFAVIELTGARFPEKFHAFGPMTAPMTAPWSPLDLPPTGVDDKNKPLSFAKALAEVIFGFVFFVWLLLLPHYPYLIWGPGASYIEASPYAFAPVCWTFYWSLIGLNAFELTWKIVDFARGARQGHRRWRHLFMRALSLIPLSILLTAPGRVLILVKNSAVSGAGLAAKAAEANRGIHQAIMVVVAIVILQVMWDAGKMGVQAYRKRVAA